MYFDSLGNKIRISLSLEMMFLCLITFSFKDPLQQPSRTFSSHFINILSTSCSEAAFDYFCISFSILPDLAPCQVSVSFFINFSTFFHLSALSLGYGILTNTASLRIFQNGLPRQTYATLSS